MWDAETKGQSQGCKVATRSLEHILAFSVVFDCFGVCEAIVNKITKTKLRYLYGMQYD